jgi:hypothetical protein
MTMPYFDEATETWIELRYVPLWVVGGYEALGGLRARYQDEIASIRRRRVDEAIAALLDEGAAA